MGLDFQGSLDDISERQLEFIQDVLEKRGYSNTKVTVDPVGVAGDNYVANVKRISVTNENGVFKMIAKIAPNNETIRTTVKTGNLFKNEHHMYTEILPKFQELEEIAEVPKEERLRFATCYGSLLEPPHEVILLEDLQTSNFIMLDRFKPLSNECVKSILKNFAKLHSLSFALKNKSRESFKEFKSHLFNTWTSILSTPETAAHLKQLEQDAVVLFEGDKYKNFFKNAIFNSLELAAKLSKTDADSKNSVIQQGDSWTNNIMFRFDGDKLQESIMIDYQLSRETNPVCDIQYMIFSCTDHQTRLEHFNDWIDYYHSELDKCLSNFGLKANYVYPRDQLDADMKRYSKVSFGQAFLLAIILSMNVEDASKIKEMMNTKDIHEMSINMSDFDDNYSNMFKKRLVDLADSYVEFGFF